MAEKGGKAMTAHPPKTWQILLTHGHNTTAAHATAHRADRLKKKKKIYKNQNK